MCGIFGIVGKKPEARVMHKMAKTLQSRGPDSQGWVIFDEAGIGATRLSIIDLKGGNQPIPNQDKSVWVVQNGEIYNYKEIRNQIEKSGTRLRTQSDTEVLAYLYSQKGVRFVDDLRGMFAIGIWDKTIKQLVLVRDRLGIKPLYWAKQDKTLLFASEIKALLAAGIDKSIDMQALSDYLTLNYVPGPKTIFKSIKKLLAGHYLVWKDGKFKITNYWSICAKQAKIESPKERLFDLLQESVKYHLISDVEVGAFLSGGVDSSVIVALASQMMDKPLKTYSVGFEQKSFNELEYAAMIAKRFGTDHKELKMDMNPVEIVDKIGQYFDEPFADSSAMAVYAISKIARSEGMKVILTGDGGDEIFGGYVTYQADQLLRLYNRLPKILREKVIASAVKRLPASHGKMAFEFKAKRFIRGAMEDPLKAHFLFKAIYANPQKVQGKQVGPKYLGPCVRLWQKVYGETKGDDVLNKLMLTDMQTSLVDDMLTKVDRMSMANSLEVRVPLLDHKLVEFMANLPSNQKVRGLTLKYLLKKTMRGILPNKILNRKKAGFHVPISFWINNELKDMLGDLLSPARIKTAGYFDETFVANMLKEHKSAKADYSREIWGLLMFELWRKNYL